MPKFLCSTNTLRHRQRPPVVTLRAVAGDIPEQETQILKIVIQHPTKAQELNKDSHRQGVLSMRPTVLSEPFTVNSEAYNKKGAMLFMVALEYSALIMQH